MPLRLYNSLSRGEETFVPKDPSRVTFYSCGPTVYDDAHIGNFRSFLAADVLRRWIESEWCEIAGPGGRPHEGPRAVVHVMNITDVGHMTDDAEGGEAGEDRMAVAGRRIAEAKKTGALPPGVDIDPNNPYDVARFYEARFRDDAKALGLKVASDAEKDPSRMPRATDNIAGMIAVIDRLVKNGYAYAVGEPGSRVVYFSVQKFPAYGRLSGNTLEALREGEGGRISAVNQSQKRHPADFLLWKEDASHIMKWESPWGKGYPGWHIECTAMSLQRLGPAFSALEMSAYPPKPADVARMMQAAVSDGEPLIDLHSGGEDNIFPHHECEVAQSACAFSGGRGTFARVWFHGRFLMVEGQKMSKSKGNFFTARDLFAKGIEPSAIRLELIRTHHMANSNFTMQGLTDCQRMIERWRRFEDAARANQSDATSEGDEAARKVFRQSFTEAMNADVNVAGAIAALNTYVNAVEKPTAADARLIDIAGDVLGVVGKSGLPRPKGTESEIGVFAAGLTPDPRVEELLRARRAARAARDFKASDVIRDQLAAMGYAVKDVAGGRVEVSRK
ncbi:MAG TPA: hypothetical protein VD971_01185 [Phycisphaerales bacterium]|nr:hypothetical protein [Phycisphaerales bacterium]